MFSNYLIGSVAFLVGGCDSITVELYSPEGECQHELAPIPMEANGNFMFYLNIQTLESW